MYKLEFSGQCDLTSCSYIPNSYSGLCPFAGVPTLLRQIHPGDLTHHNSEPKEFTTCNSRNRLIPDSPHLF